MDHTPDCDEQSEVLFVFTEDAADNQSPPATSPPPTVPPPPHLTESADQAFWSGVYTLDPPHALMGVLTDLHIHRFLLHQHLATHTHTALSETPIGHQPLTDTLPQPIQRIIAHLPQQPAASATSHTALLSTQSTVWLASHQLPTSQIPTCPPQTHSTFLTRPFQHPAAYNRDSLSTFHPSDATHYRPPPTQAMSSNMSAPRPAHHGSQFWTHL